MDAKTLLVERAKTTLFYRFLSRPLQNNNVKRPNLGNLGEREPRRPIFLDFLEIFLRYLEYPEIIGRFLGKMEIQFLWGVVLGITVAIALNPYCSHDCRSVVSSSCVGHKRRWLRLRT